MHVDERERVSFLVGMEMWMGPQIHDSILIT
jgi:hypothetical protein